MLDSHIGIHVDTRMTGATADGRRRWRKDRSYSVSHHVALPLGEPERTSTGCFKLVMNSWRQMTP